MKIIKLITELAPHKVLKRKWFQHIKLCVI